MVLQECEWEGNISFRQPILPFVSSLYPRIGRKLDEGVFDDSPFIPFFLSIPFMNIEGLKKNFKEKLIVIKKSQ